MTPRWLRRARAGTPIRPPRRVTAGWWNGAVVNALAREDRVSGVGGHVNRGDRARARGRGHRLVDAAVDEILGGGLLALLEASGYVLEDWQRTYLRGLPDPASIRMLVARQNGRTEAARQIADALALAERLGAFQPTGLQPAARLDLPDRQTPGRG